MARIMNVLWVIAAILAWPLTAAGQSGDAAGGGEFEPTQRVLIRFVTTDDFPPFNANDEDGILTGFNVDLARAICLDLAIACDIKVLPWNNLIPALDREAADAVIAAHRVSADLARRVGITDRYFYTPARFAVRRNSPAFSMTPRGLDGRTVAVVRGSAHEAYLLSFFRNVGIKAFETPELAREALQTGRTDAVFGDGIGLVFWANGTLSKGCCALRGGPFFEARYFGDGIAMLVRKTDNQMRKMLNRAVRDLQANGRFQELLDRYFPIRVY
ncbi:MAG: transporter substrate-binding domain-containing protein [Hyphomicrobiaceae bacterium]